MMENERCTLRNAKVYTRMETNGGCCKLLLYPQILQALKEPIPTFLTP